MFENKVLRSTFGPQKDKVTSERRKPQSAELNTLYFLPNIVRVMKWRRMRWAGHVARMGERRGVYRVLVTKPEAKRSFGIFRKWYVEVWTRSSWLRIVTSGGHL